MFRAHTSKTTNQKTLPYNVGVRNRNMYLKVPIPYSNTLTANIQNKNDIQFLSQLVKRLLSKHLYCITMYISLYTITKKGGVEFVKHNKHIKN
jgi:hypothetical protein